MSETKQKKRPKVRPRGYRPTELEKVLQGKGMIHTHKVIPASGWQGVATVTEGSFDKEQAKENKLRGYW